MDLFVNLENSLVELMLTKRTSSSFSEVCTQLLLHLKLTWFIVHNYLDFQTSLYNSIPTYWYSVNTCNIFWRIKLLKWLAYFKIRFKLCKIWLVPDFYVNPVQRFRIEISVLRSCHSDDPTFGANTGVQFVCISLFALCWSNVVLTNGRLLI